MRKLSTCLTLACLLVATAYSQIKFSDETKKYIELQRFCNCI